VIRDKPLLGYVITILILISRHLTSVTDRFYPFLSHSSFSTLQVDSADRRRLRDCRDELGALLGQEKLAGATILIFANKQDLAGALTCEELAEALDLKSAAFEKRHWQIVPCSAVTGEGLIEGVDFLVQDIASRIFLGSD